MPLNVKQLRISAEEHKQRCDKLLDHLQINGYSGLVLFDNAYVQYYCGFSFIPTERPMAFVMSAKGERGLFVPRLELEHAAHISGSYDCQRRRASAPPTVRVSEQDCKKESSSFNMHNKRWPSNYSRKVELNWIRWCLA